MLARTTFCVMVMGLCSVLAAAPTGKKKAGVGDFPFWSAPKVPHARDFVPGLSAALRLTDEQVRQIQAAQQQTVESQEVRAARQLGKDPAASKVMQEANEKLHAEVASILSTEQKALIARINAAWADTLAFVGKDMQSQYGATKGNPEATAKLRAEGDTKIREAFQQKLETILTPEQKQAVAKAAEEIKKRPAEAPKKGAKRAR